jgi:hypothetical protein
MSIIVPLARIRVPTVVSAGAGGPADDVVVGTVGEEGRRRFFCVVMDVPDVRAGVLRDDLPAIRELAGRQNAVVVEDQIVAG